MMTSIANNSGCGYTADIFQQFEQESKQCVLQTLKFWFKLKISENSILLSWLFWLRLPRMNDMEKTDPHYDAMINKNMVIMFSFDIHSLIQFPIKASQDTFTVITSLYKFF